METIMMTLMMMMGDERHNIQLPEIFANAERE
jgi:hypothetical protein